MLCKDAEDLIKNYRLGSITADNFLLLIQHTKECEKCHRTFEEAETSMERGTESGFSHRLVEYYENFTDWIRQKQEAGKIYTRKSFYFIIMLVFLVLDGIGIVYSGSFNNFYLITSTFVVLSMISLLMMLFTAE